MLNKKKKTKHKKLRFNYSRATISFLDMIEQVAIQVTERFYAEASNGSMTGMVKIDYPEVDAALKYIHSQVLFNADAVMESFGTGSKMDTQSKYLADYMKSNLWNPLRQGYTITGRAAGEYTNIYGEQVTSSGGYAGMPLEKIIGDARKPTYTIQNAEKWLQQENGYVTRLLSLNIQKWINEKGSSFFEYK